jgi:plastocyanin
MAASVNISGFAYAPVNVVVAQGGTVTWTNKDSAAHTATGSGFDTGSLAQNASKAVTFATKGTFDYVCTFHSNMRGTVTVQ